MASNDFTKTCVSSFTENFARITFFYAFQCLHARFRHNTHTIFLGKISSYSMAENNASLN